VFYVCAAINVVGALIFGTLAQGEVQPWARDPEVDEEMTMPPSGDTVLALTGSHAEGGEPLLTNGVDIAQEAEPEISADVTHQPQDDITGDEEIKSRHNTANHTLLVDIGVETAVPNEAPPGKLFETGSDDIQEAATPGVEVQDSIKSGGHVNTMEFSVTPHDTTSRDQLFGDARPISDENQIITAAQINGGNIDNQVTAIEISATAHGSGGHTGTGSSVPSGGNIAQYAVKVDPPNHVTPTDFVPSETDTDLYTDRAGVTETCANVKQYNLTIPAVGVESRAVLPGYHTERDNPSRAVLPGYQTERHNPNGDDGQDTYL
jgi:hypothetical protein